MSYVEELRRLAIDAGKQDDPEVLSLLKTVALTQDQGLYEAAKLMLQAAASEQQAKRDMFHPYAPPERISSGPIVIGEIVGNGATVGIYPEELGQGGHVAGRSGSGKTELVERILPRWVELGGKCLIFDFKDSYIHMVKYLPDCSVMTLGEDLPVNLLETSMKGLESIYRRTTGLFTSGEFTFRNCLKELMDRLSTERTGIHPSVQELLEHAERISYPRWSEEAKSHERMLKRLSVMAESLGETATIRKGIGAGELLSHNLVVRTGNLPSDIMEFAIECIIHRCFTYRMERGEKMSWRNLIVLDEATAVFSAKKDRLEGQSYSEFVNLASKGREYGLQFLSGSQLPQYMSPAALGNSFVRVLLPLGHGQDYFVMAQALGLNQQQLAEAYKLKQEPGNWEAILKLSGRWTLPMRVRLYPSGLDRNISWEEVRRLSKPLVDRFHEQVVMRPVHSAPPAPLTRVDRTGKTKAKNHRDDEKGMAARAPVAETTGAVQPSRPASEGATADASQQRHTTSALSNDELGLLLDINERPLHADSERGFEANWLRRTKAKLVNHGLITIVTAHDGTHGGPVRLPQLTEAGAKAIEAADHEVKAPRNWIAHRYTAAKLMQRLSAQGVRIISSEFHEANGNITDIVADLNGTRFGIEVQLSEDWQAAYKHLRKLVELYDRILLVAPTKQLRQIRSGLRRGLAQDQWGRIQQKVLFCDLGSVISRITEICRRDEGKRVKDEV